MKNNKERKAYLDDVSHWKPQTHDYLVKTRILEYGGRTYVRVYVHMHSQRYDESVKKLKEVKEMTLVFQGELLDDALKYIDNIEISNQMKAYDNRMKKVGNEK